jgi:uncharacterized coiled-coil protein SlyX
MAKHTRSSNQEALMESVNGQTNQLQSNLEKLAIKVCAVNQKIEGKMANMVIEHVKLPNRGFMRS